ncbi:MAG: acylphosphatase [Treponema sp.]|jgi:acylphosphatase|nr:acylphosphatase [Treponema sp.]
MAAFFARVQGRVQGVGFRYSAIQEARRAGITGWVRNNADGDVEVWAEGPPEKLAAFLRWLRKGPPYARVEAVNREEKQPRGYREFGVEY